MSNKGSIATFKPNFDEGLARIRSGDVAGLFATDGICSYEFLGCRPDGRLDVKVTAASGHTRREAYKFGSIELKTKTNGWAFESELDAYLRRERYVRLDPDTCATVALQLVHKCMRNPMEAFHDRISDDEMMEFNKGTLNRVFTVLVHLFDPMYRTHLVEVLQAPRNWDLPSIDGDSDPWARAWGGHRPDVSLKAPWRGDQAG